MKLGCCVNMLASTKAGIGNEFVEIFSELGYDYIELPLAQVMALTDLDFKEMFSEIRSIPVEVCNNFFPVSMRLTGEEFNMPKISEYVKKATERAAEMGVKVIVLGSADAKNIPEGFSYDKGKSQFIELLYHLQNVVEALDINIVLEPLNVKESNFILNLGEAIAIMEEVSCKNIKVLVDYYHMRMENESQSMIIKAGSNLKHVHIASKEGRRFPNENDGEDYEYFFTNLKAIGYDGRVSVEGYSENIKEDAKRAALLLRRFMNGSVTTFG